VTNINKMDFQRKLDHELGILDKTEKKREIER